MEAQQIKLNINELMNGIQDEVFLQACFEAVNGIAKAYFRVAGQPNGAALAKGAVDKARVGKPSGQSGADLGSGEKAQPHDLSMALLANEVLKGSEPLPEEAILAFNDALEESAITEPTLPNRL